MFLHTYQGASPREAMLRCILLVGIFYMSRNVCCFFAPFCSPSQDLDATDNLRLWLHVLNRVYFWGEQAVLEARSVAL